jgi:hypothetical protein
MQGYWERGGGLAKGRFPLFGSLNISIALFNVKFSEKKFANLAT